MTAIGSTGGEEVEVKITDKKALDKIMAVPKDIATMLASEEVNRRNTEAAVNHGNETRKMFRILEQRMGKLEETMRALGGLLEQYRTQLASLQQQFYAKGTTSYADGE